MSGGGTEASVGGEAAAGGGDKKRDSLGTAGSPAHLIIKGTEWEGYRPGGPRAAPAPGRRPLTRGRAPGRPPPGGLVFVGGGGFVPGAGLFLCARCLQY